MKFQVIFTFDAEYAGYVAEVPELPGCVSQGKTLDEAIENIKDAIKGYLVVLEKHGKPYISLPDTIQADVEEQVAQGSYSSVSEYFLELVRQDQKRVAQERLETMLLEGLNSGDATEMTAQDWEDIHQAVRDRISQFQGTIESLG